MPEDEYKVEQLGMQEQDPTPGDNHTQTPGSHDIIDQVFAL